jgi:hypothetical protein
LIKKTSLELKNFQKLEVVVDPVVLALNFSLFGTKHQNGETSSLKPHCLTKEKHTKSKSQ